MSTSRVIPLIMNLVSISCGGRADWGFVLLRDLRVPLPVIFGDLTGRALDRPRFLNGTYKMGQKTVHAPIASATNLAQMTDLIESTKLVLTPSEIERLNQASALT
jgi:hypothetical protein